MARLAACRLTDESGYRVRNVIPVSPEADVWRAEPKRLIQRSNSPKPRFGLITRTRSGWFPSPLAQARAGESNPRYLTTKNGAQTPFFCLIFHRFGIRAHNHQVMSPMGSAFLPFLSARRTSVAKIVHPGRFRHEPMSF